MASGGAQAAEAPVVRARSVRRPRVLSRAPAAVWAIAALALLIRVAVVLATPDWQPVHDPRDYDLHAQSIAAGHGYPESPYAPAGGPTALRPPLYPYALAGVYKVLGHEPTAGRLFGALMGTLTVALIGLVAWQLWRRRTVAYAAMGLAAIYPPLVLANATLISEAIGLPLMLGALSAALAARGRERPWGLAVAAGLLTGLAILDRPALGVLVVPVVLGLWGRPWRQPRAVLAPALAVAAVGVTLVPWTIRNAVEMDAFIPVSTQSGYLLAGTYNDTSRHDPVWPGLYRPASDVPALQSIVRDPSLDEVALERKLRAAGRRYMRDNPGYVAQVAWWNSRRITLLDRGPEFNRFALSFQGIGTRPANAATWSWYAVALLAIAGLALTRGRVGPPWFWLTPVLLFASVVVISSDTRYRLPLEPFAVLLAALALTAAWARLRDRSAAPRPARTPHP